MSLYLDADLLERVEKSRLEYNKYIEADPRKKEIGFRTESPSQFNIHIFMLGLLDFEFRVLPKLTGKKYKPYCDLSS